MFDSNQEGKMKVQSGFLLFSVFVIASCGIFYQLLISTVSTYFLGSGVLYFSLTIGLFLFFMGVGSYLSKYIEKDLLEWFIRMEIFIGVIGGFSSFLLYYAFSVTQAYFFFSILVIASISTLMGLEIPIVVRILKERHTLKDTIAHILTFDYVGALVASVIFPLILLPYLGIMRTSFLIGFINILIATVGIYIFWNTLKKKRVYLAVSVMGLIILVAGFIFSFSITKFFENYAYQDRIIFTEQSPYQRIVVTKFKEDIRLFLNGNLQFSSVDEYRYHESLVHIPLSYVKQKEQVLVLGGGDGLVVRELLKYPEVQHITVVDIDPKITDFAKKNKFFLEMNEQSLLNTKVKIINEDALKFIENTEIFYNVVIIDLPDPEDPTLGRLYSKEFYERVKQRMSVDGLLVTQATSPYFAREAYWTIGVTLESEFSWVKPYTVYVPSFGQWGFFLAGKNIKDELPVLKVPTRYLTSEIIPTLFIFDSDSSKVPAEVNTLSNQILVRKYEKSWENVNLE
jgi:spermidine synthase